MPSYLFTVQEGHLPTERLSQDLAGPRQARSETVILAGEMLREADAEVWDVLEWQPQVTDERGATVWVLTIAGVTEMQSQTGSTGP